MANNESNTSNKRVSWLGYEFDFESDTWLLGQDGKNHFDFEKMRLRLPEKELFEVKTALAKTAENKPLRGVTISALNILAEFSSQG